MNQDQPARTVLIAGGTGLIGSALVEALLDRGDRVVVLTRVQSKPLPEHPNLSESRWDPASGVLNQAVVDGADVVVNLAGASIGTKRWTSVYKRTILVSRTDPTEILAQAIRNSPTPPDVFLQGSASGYYGERHTIADENSPLGKTFLAQVCARWEKAAAPALDGGTRLAYLRTATVMTPKDGALKQVLTPIRFGVGSVLGTGQQVWSWITLADQIRAMLFVMDNRSAWGPINLVAPENATNAQITHALAKALSRPSWLKVPAWALRLALGEFADEILMDQKIGPMILTELGFRFTHPEVSDLVTYVTEEL